ncbi:hypothetical protein PVK06_015975 [Gossypium arboreum]|uniref:DUF4283 domain-containing protein n=1 Tax=Gossypium arboreum TaxID=29729 RepID=A0ABR0PZ16_GOSAR|nr:hypothetical protein PVK06_015975 [Gossypium arboreum]
MEVDLENLKLEDEEEELIPCEKNLIEDENEHQLCLVGKASIDCVNHFPSLKRTLADLWHLLRGVIISYLEDKRYLFRFLYEVDIKRVIDGMSWSFNKHLIVFHCLVTGEDPKQILLNHAYFSIQVHRSAKEVSKAIWGLYRTIHSI